MKTSDAETIATTANKMVKTSSSQTFLCQTCRRLANSIMILIAAHGESGFHPACFDCAHFAYTGCRC